MLTDHKPLTIILGPKTGIPALAAARLQRWAILLSAYRYDVEYRHTDQHANADGLSRLPLSENGPVQSACPGTVFNLTQIASLPVKTEELRQATSQDPVLSKVLRYTMDGWPVEMDEDLKPYHRRQHEISVEAGCLLWGMRVIIPSTLQQWVLSELHTSHPGMVKMKSLARTLVWWPQIDKQIEHVVSRCTSCQKQATTCQSAPMELA